MIIEYTLSVEQYDGLAESKYEINNRCDGTFGETILFNNEPQVMIMELLCGDFYANEQIIYQPLVIKIYYDFGQIMCKVKSSRCE